MNQPTYRRVSVDDFGNSFLALIAESRDEDLFDIDAQVRFCLDGLDGHVDEYTLKLFGAI